MLRMVAGRKRGGGIQIPIADRRPMHVKLNLVESLAARILRSALALHAGFQGLKHQAPD
jgi:hypothetical protein